MTDKQPGRPGPVGEMVARNIAAIRKQRRLTYVELAARLARIGRPIPVLGLRRIVNGERRVDVDDLAALAQVFDVTPAQLAAPLTDCTTCHGVPAAGYTCTECSATAVKGIASMAG